MPGARPAYLRRRTRAAGRRAGSTWSSSRARRPAEDGLGHVEVGEVVLAPELAPLQLRVDGIDQDLEILPDRRFGLGREPPASSARTFRVASAARVSKPGLRSKISSSRPAMPRLAAPSGLKRARASSTTWVFWSLFATQAGGDGCAAAEPAVRSRAARVPSADRTRAAG